MSTNLQGKVVVVTGATGGMGLATAKMLAARGAKVSLSGLRDERLREIVGEIAAAGGQAMAQVVDVRDRGQVDGWMAQTAATFGRIDGAANLAGVIPTTFFADTVEHQDDDAAWEDVVRTNLTGTMYCMRAELRHMRDGGSVVNCGSTASVVGEAGCAAYAASKHGVVGLTKSAAKEVGPTRGIRVNCIAPGMIDTPMYRKVVQANGGEPVPFKQQIKREGRPDEIASLICFLLSDESQYITGSVQMIDGGWTC